MSTTTALDPKNQQILAERIAKREKLSGPQVGDFLQMPDGALRRVAYDWGDSIQPTSGRAPSSIHLTKSGKGNHSGGLDPVISKDRLSLVGKRSGRFWIFSHARWAAHNGVDVEAPCNVYEVAPQ